MSRLPPVSTEDRSQDVAAQLDAAVQLMGFTPNDGLIMARSPAILSAFGGLVQAVLGQGTVAPALKRLVGLVSSAAAGCRYCQAHAALGAQRHGVPPEKLAALWDFEQSALFTDAERAALTVAWHAAMSPNAVTDGQFESLRAHFSDAEATEIVAVIGLYGFLNRWNSTLATDIEPEPATAHQALRSLDRDTNS